MSPWYILNVPFASLTRNILWASPNHDEGEARKECMIKIDLDKLTNGTIICIAEELGCECEYPDSEDREDFIIYMQKVKLWLEERYGM